MLFIFYFLFLKKLTLITTIDINNRIMELIIINIGEKGDERYRERVWVVGSIEVIKERTNKTKIKKTEKVRKKEK